MKIILQRVNPNDADRFVEQVRRLSQIEYQRRHEMAVRQISYSQ